MVTGSWYLTHYGVHVERDGEYYTLYRDVKRPFNRADLHAVFTLEGAYEALKMIAPNTITEDGDSATLSFPAVGIEVWIDFFRPYIVVTMDGHTLRVVVPFGGRVADFDFRAAFQADPIRVSVWDFENTVKTMITRFLAQGKEAKNG